jgi:3-isopropylmalate/(R)-2-methylmalate dehydratase small subunit
MDKLAVSSLKGHVVPIPGIDIDTDQIVPARFLKQITFDKMGEYLFYDARFTNDTVNHDHPLNQPEYANASIMLVEHNFGCGSSREHAPQAIMRAGFKAIIGESFAEIFSGNCKALGIVTVTLPRLTIQQLFQHVAAFPNSAFSIDVEASTLAVDGFPDPFAITQKDTHKKAFLNGTWDELTLLKSNHDKITELAKQLPYLDW